MTSRLQSVIILLLSVGATVAHSAGCTDAEGFRELDFWVGDWNVVVDDQQVGTNHIIKVLDGCAVEEHWVDAGGSRGMSLFYYMPSLGEWRQVWVTEQATMTGGVKEKRLGARLKGGGLRFLGEISRPDGTTYQPTPWRVN